MKKPMLFIITLIVMMSSISVLNLQATNAGDRRHQIIVVRSGGTSTTPVLRSAAFIPIDAWYDADNKTIEVTFLQDVGAATISVDGITQHTSGEAGVTEYIYFSGDVSGEYTITISCANATYTGTIYIE